jgi:hypothetical protein
MTSPILTELSRNDASRCLPERGFALDPDEGCE